ARSALLSGLVFRGLSRGRLRGNRLATGPPTADRPRTRRDERDVPRPSLLDEGRDRADGRGHQGGAGAGGAGAAPACTRRGAHRGPDGAVRQSLPPLRRSPERGCTGGAQRSVVPLTLSLSWERPES